MPKVSAVTAEQALNPLASVSGHAVLFCTLKLFGQRRLLRHLLREGLIHRGVVIDAIPGAHQQRGTGDGAPGNAHARFNTTLVGRDQRVGIFCAGQRSHGMTLQHRRHRREARGDVEIHQAAV